MLILTRRQDERIFIGDDIYLSVLEIEGNRVKIGIEAPRDVTILREELSDGARTRPQNDPTASSDP